MLYWLSPPAAALSPIEAKPVRKRARILESKTIFRGRVVKLKVERVVEPGEVETTREVVCHPGSVVVVPHLPDGRLILVRQYRHAVQESLWELVAGGMEPGETPRQSARRELLEETGYLARVLKPFLEFYPSPGLLSEKMHLVEAWDLTPSKGQPDADERIETGFFRVDKILEMIRRKEIRDGKTLVGILLLFGSPATSDESSRSVLASRLDKNQSGVEPPQSKALRATVRTIAAAHAVSPKQNCRIRRSILETSSTSTCLLGTGSSNNFLDTSSADKL